MVDLSAGVTLKLMEDLEKNSTPLLYYVKLCASFQSHQWIQTVVPDRKCSIWVTISDFFLSRVTLKFDGWPCKKGHISYTMLSFVDCFKATGEFKMGLQSGNAQFGSRSAMCFRSQSAMCLFPCDRKIWQMTLKNNRAIRLHYAKLLHHSKAMGEFKLELHSGNAQFGSKSVIILSHVSLKFGRRPWKTLGHLFSIMSSCVHHFKAIREFKLELKSEKTNSSQNRRFFVPFDLWVWRMILKNIRVPLLWCFKICVSFHSHQWIQTDLTVWKRQNEFCPRWRWCLTSDCDLLHGHHFGQW